MNKKTIGGQSTSLTTSSLSPGWTDEESELLKVALMKFGIGKWSILLKANILPQKSLQQIFMQTQRLLGQQALAGFMGLKVDIDQINKDNLLKDGVRKYNQILINHGDKMTSKQRIELISENRLKYGLCDEYIRQLKLPKPSNIRIWNVQKIINSNRRLTIAEKLEHLQQLKGTLFERLNFVQEGGVVENFTNQKYEEFKFEITKKENPEAFRKSTRSEPEYQGSSVDDVDERGKRIKGEDKAKIKSENVDITECILQRRSSEESSSSQKQSSFKGAKIKHCVREQQTPPNRLSSDKIAAVFKIKDTTPYEKKLTKAGKNKKERSQHHVKDHTEQHKKKRDNSSSMEEALDKEFEKQTKKNPNLRQTRNAIQRERRAPSLYGKHVGHQDEDENIAYLKDCYRDKLYEIDKKKALIDAQRLAKYEEMQRQKKLGPIIVVIEKSRLLNFQNKFIPDKQKITREFQESREEVLIPEDIQKHSSTSQSSDQKSDDDIDLIIKSQNYEIKSQKY